ncbi:MAG TPA: beta-N-acetylhexosaminidase, partial [Deltaproteobacteria bacterium]|nr:beta-N-acetylhexosaminidase [Deltaproteobacteria bacterium]
MAPSAHGRRAQGDETTLADHKRRAGQRILMGIGGPALTADERRTIREIRPGGFILFARNVVEPAQVLELNRELWSLLPDRNPPLLSVDQEGGRVLRVKSIRWPAMRTVGNLDHLPTTQQVASAMATELRAMGFNLNFAPVADVDSNPRNPVIGDRSFGRDPDKVSHQVVAFARGLEAHGIIACVKHFPGHGDTDVDSHKALPVVDKDLYDIQNVELIPFRTAVEAGIGMVMTSHVLFPALDDQYPATMSRKVLHRLLREDLGYDGVVISDDLEMKAVRGRWRMAEVLDRASRASVDLFCIGRSFEPDLTLSIESWEVLIRLQESDPGHHAQARTAVRRLDALRERHWL